MFTFLAIVSIICLFVGLFKPQIFKLQSKKNVVYVFGLAFFVIISIGSTLNFSNSSGPVNTSPEPVKPQTAHIGDEAYLRTSTSTTGTVLVATTRENLKQIVKSSIAGDTVGLMNTVRYNQAFLVNEGTKVKIIDSEVGVRQIRILEGDKIDQSAWVPMEFISLK